MKCTSVNQLQNVSENVNMILVSTAKIMFISILPFQPVQNVTRAGTLQLSN